MPNRKPLWDWTKGITQSGLDRFNSCREQFSLEYIDGYTSRAFSVPLEFGTIIHLAIQRQEEIKSRKSADDLIREICEAYHKARFPQLRGRLDQDSMAKTLAMAEVLFPLYYEHNVEDDALQKWTSREHLFEVPYEIPLAGGIGSAKVTLRGIQDSTYRTKKKDLLGLFETKTKSQIDDNAIASGLRADLQSMFYLNALQIETGETPKELLYNIIRRPGQKYLDRDTYATFKLRIKDDIKKRPSYYFRRWEVNVIASDIEQFRTRVLDPALRLMLQWWESVKDYPFDRWRSPYHFANLSALHTKYGSATMYGLMVLGRRKDYFVRSSVFPELDNVTSKAA